MSDSDDEAPVAVSLSSARNAALARDSAAPTQQRCALHAASTRFCGALLFADLTLLVFL